MELGAFRAFETGASYLRVIEGRLHAYHAWEQLPDANADPLTVAHWGGTGVKEFGGLPKNEGWHSPGIIATGIGAGCGKDTGCQKRSQDILTECGFVCLRSPRGLDGKYWEQWVLHFMGAAKGPLKEHIDKWRNDNPKATNWFTEAEEACRYISRDLHVHYGSLDITIQRWALTYD
jgi:hypothetical protein